MIAAAPVVAFVKDADGRYVYANPHLLASLGERFGPDWYGKTDADLWPPDAAARLRANDEAALRSGPMPAFSDVLPFEDGLHTFLITKFPLTGTDGRTYLGGIGLDETERARIAAEHDWLATVVEQVAESVIITDVEGRITYVNPAFERTSGYTREQVIGQNPRILSSGLMSPAFYAAMWAALTHGSPWAADFVNRRADGALFTEESLISPIRDASGVVTSYAAVTRDVTEERALEQRSLRQARERALIADTLRGLGPRDTAEATAQAICRQVLNLTGVAAAQLFVFELDGRAMPIGFTVAGQPDPPLRRLPYQRSRHLRERAAEGPWIEPWVNRPWHPYNALLVGLGVHLAAYAPVRWDGKLIGMLVIDAAKSATEATITESLAALVEFADLAAAVIGRDVADRTETGAARERVQAIITRQQFHPVFQPIVDLETDAVVGYEALTRFDDGVAPDVRFGDADAVGLGHQLEAATLEVALAAGEALPHAAWLNLNASPTLIVAGQPLRNLVRGTRRHLVLEVTEHAAIADYLAFRAAVAALRPKVGLAVDDTGAGFASLRHILELHPEFVKLDRSLVTGLESDAARQALIVGLHHFASSTNCRLIAEGIETEAELKILRSLDIPLGQGFLLGRPTPSGAR